MANANFNLAGSPLDTWDLLNATVRVANEETCLQLLKAELAGKRRQQFLFRIHSRLNRMRADRERRELTGALTKLQGTPPWLK